MGLNRFLNLKLNFFEIPCRNFFKIWKTKFWQPEIMNFKIKNRPIDSDLNFK